MAKEDYQTFTLYATNKVKQEEKRRVAAEKEKKTELESVEDFLARGGEINHVPWGRRENDWTLRQCKCGCKGKFSAHKPTKLGNVPS